MRRGSSPFSNFSRIASIGFPKTSPMPGCLPPCSSAFFFWAELLPIQPPHAHDFSLGGSAWREAKGSVLVLGAGCGHGELPSS